MSNTRESGMDRYSEFLSRKRIVSAPVGISAPPALHDSLFPFQRDITQWALRRGRAALFEECGLGKSRQAIEWARIVSAHTDLPVLILTPLSVAAQFVREGAAIGVTVTHCRERSDVAPGVNVTNYDRFERFPAWQFGGVVLDESSILKATDGKTRTALLAAFDETPFRLACTATPAPNDHMELGNHAEFLGIMTASEMLSMFFVHDGGETQTTCEIIDVALSDRAVALRFGTETLFARASVGQLPNINNVLSSLIYTARSEVDAKRLLDSIGAVRSVSSSKDLTIACAGSSLKIESCGDSEAIDTIEAIGDAKFAASLASEYLVGALKSCDKARLSAGGELDPIMLSDAELTVVISPLRPEMVRKAGQ